jgi:SAM-dependent methyltransferase
MGYIELMPLSGRDGEVVLDFGCGPGHDLVGFAEYGKAARIVGIDVSASSLAEASQRLALHDASVDVHLASPADPGLPFEDESVDYIHSSGVLHHIPDPGPVLREFHRVLKPGGKGRFMVYFQDSLWYHLYVSYHLRRLRTDYSGLTQQDAFTRSTDGPNCPVSRCYTAQEATNLLQEHGLECRFIGSAISLLEMSLLPSRFEAMMHEGLEHQHRDFLAGLRFDDRGVPLHRGAVAGIDAVFEFTKP